MRRLFHVLSGDHSFTITKKIQARTCRIASLSYTNSGANEFVHVRVGSDTQNFDESQSIYYTTAFYSPSGSQAEAISEHPTKETMHRVDGGTETVRFQIFINGSIAGDLTSQHVYIELDYE